MRQNLFIDTNYICALFNEKDSLHEKAKVVSKTVRKYQFVTSNFILLETYTILSQRISKEFVIQLGQQLQDLELYNIFWIAKTAEKTVWDIFTSIKDKNFSYVDASILAVMRKEKIKHLLSFDASFEPLQEKFNFKLIGS